MTTAAPFVAAAGNSEQVRAWDGDEGEHWTVHADHYDAAARDYQQLLAAAAAVSAGEHALDVGCGTGASTRAAGRAAQGGSAVGIDLSARMLELARTRAAADGLDHVRFVHGDAQVHPFAPAAFDVVLSRFGAMFFADHVAAFTNLGRATRAGGRLVLLAWQGLDRNEWLTAIRGSLAAGRDLPAPAAGTPSPFGLCEEGYVREVLAGGGWTDVGCENVTLPFRLGDDADDAFAFLRGTGAAVGLLQGLTPDAAQQALDRLRATLAVHETADGVVFGSAAWLVTARRP